MEKFKSNYPSLGFYVNGALKRFSSGFYVTDDKDELAVLNTLVDAKRVDESQATKPEAEKPAPKAPAKRTASAK